MRITADDGTYFFFFKQKTAYEMSASLVGSEMCIRDRTQGYLPTRKVPFIQDTGSSHP